jgi:hypothetical protein
VNDENFCAGQYQNLPPGTSVRQETRNGDETWCSYQSPFTSLDDLVSLYGTSGTTINQVSLDGNRLTYDLSLDLGSDTDLTSDVIVNWIVTMPGKVVETNADDRQGNTLTWNLVNGEVNHIRAVSDTSSGLDFGGNNLYYIIAGLCLCLCVIVVIIVAVVLFFVLRRKKNAPTVE